MIIMAAISDAPWDGSPSNWKDTDAYCASCLIDQNESGKPKTQANCKLPYKFPDGDISRVSVHNCAASLAGARGGVKGLSAAERKAAARKLVSLYRQLKEDPPPSIKNMAQ
jgi:hypothetical protein